LASYVFIEKNIIRMVKAIQTLILISFLINANSICGQSGSIKGQVRTESEPLQNVIVKIENLTITAITDSLGNYEINNLADGNYKISAKKYGYLQQSFAVVVKGGNAIIKNLSLKAEFLEIEAVKISGNNKKSINIIDKVDLQLRPVSSSQDLLRLVPGLFIAQHAGGGKAEQIFLRGFDVDHGTDFAIYVDGIPVNMPSHAHGQGYADLHFLIPETVSQLEVNKGPHNTQYGDLATAGSGSFKTFNKLSNNIVKAEYGMFGTKRALAMIDLLGSKKLFSKYNESFYIASEFKYTDAYFNSPQNFKRFNIFTKYNGQFKNGDNITVSLSTFQSSWDASGQIPLRKVLDGTISRFGSIDNTEGGKTGRTNLNVLWSKRLSERITMDNQVFYSRYDFSLYSNFTFFLNDSINGDQIRQVDQRNVLGYNSKLNIQSTFLNKQLSSTVGYGVRYDNALLQLNNTKKREFLDRKIYGKLNQVNTWIYADETLKINPKLSLNGGVRADIYNFNYADYINDSNSGNEVKAIVNPKVNAIYTFNNQVQLSAKSGFGFHSNDARAVVIGKLENTLARAFGNELGVIFKPTKKMIVNAVAWTLDLESELVYVGDEGIVEAVGASRRYGIDFGLRYQVSNKLFVDADINVNKGYLKEMPKEANSIPLAPNFTSIGGLTYKSNKGFSGSLRYRYMGDRPAIEDNSIVASGYFLTDAVINYTYKKYQFGLSVENLFNSQWKEAQFATETRLKDEVVPVNEIHFTPGTPFSLRAVVSYSF